MGWGFRRSLKLGLLRLNLSKSGVGYSVGVRGFRVGKDAKGRSYTAASIPGTGLYNRTYANRSSATPETATSGAGVPPQERGGNGRAVVLAFLAGGVLTLILVGLFSSRPVPPPTPAPAAVAAPVAPQPVPAKRRRTARKSKRAKSPEDSDITAGSEAQSPSH